MSDNLKGILWMTLAMLAFASADVIFKILTQRLPPGQLVALVGFSSGTIFALWAWMVGDKVDWKIVKTRACLMRIGSEMFGTTAFITGLALAPLAVISAISQISPLLVTLMAAVFMGAQVGLRRWTAIVAGLFGVLLIIAPWGQAFNPAALFGFLAAIGLSVRDIATRMMPRHMSNLVLAALGLFSVVPAGILLIFVPFSAPPIWPDTNEWVLLAITMGIICVAYYAITAAMRVGDVPVVTPFRYTRILFALVFAVVFIGEVLTVATLIGAAIVVAAGLYTLWRERKTAA